MSHVKLSQEEPTLPEGKTVETSSTQEKIDYLSRLRNFSDYLAEKIRRARAGTSSVTDEECSSPLVLKDRKDDRAILQVEKSETRSSRDTHDGVQENDDEQTDSTNSIFSINSDAEFISLPTPSPFHSQEFRRLYPTQDSHQSENHINSANAWSDTEVVASTAKEGQSDGEWKQFDSPDLFSVSQESDSKVADGTENARHDQSASATYTPMRSQSSDSWPPLGQRTRSEEDISITNQRSCEEQEDASDMTPLGQNGDETEAERNMLRQEAYNALSLAYYKLSQLQQLSFEGVDDRILKNLTAEAIKISQRMTHYIKKAEGTSTL